jgi:hypothetical protein
VADGITFLGDVRSLEDSTNLGALATRALVRNQSTCPILESPAPLHGKSIMLDFDHDAILDIASLGAEATYGLVGDQSTSHTRGVQPVSAGKSSNLSAIMARSYRQRHPRC